MAKKAALSIPLTQKVYVLFDKWQDPTFSGTLDEIANYLAAEEDADVSEYSLYEMGPKLDFKYFPAKVVL